MLVPDADSIVSVAKTIAPTANECMQRPMALQMYSLKPLQSSQ
jgi:hypothetical protein